MRPRQILRHPIAVMRVCHLLLVPSLASPVWLTQPDPFGVYGRISRGHYFVQEFLTTRFSPNFLRRCMP